MLSNKLTGKSLKRIKMLTANQRENMRMHSKHHTPKHMVFMKKLMLQGHTFTQAHKLTQREVGT